MKHNHNHSCRHDNVKFCNHCNMVYCNDCNQEWTPRYAALWQYQQPWYRGLGYATQSAIGESGTAYTQSANAGTACKHAE